MLKHRLDRLQPGKQFYTEIKREDFKKKPSFEVMTGFLDDDLLKDKISIVEVTKNTLRILRNSSEATLLVFS